MITLNFSQIIFENSRISSEEIPDFSTAAANIFLADMKSFSETVDLRINTDTTIFNEKIDMVFVLQSFQYTMFFQIVLKHGASITINRIAQTSGGSTSPPTFD